MLSFFSHLLAGASGEMSLLPNSNTTKFKQDFKKDKCLMKSFQSIQDSILFYFNYFKGFMYLFLKKG